MCQPHVLTPSAPYLRTLPPSFNSSFPAEVGVQLSSPFEHDLGGFVPSVHCTDLFRSDQSLIRTLVIFLPRPPRRHRQVFTLNSPAPQIPCEVFPFFFTFLFIQSELEDHFHRVHRVPFSLPPVSRLSPPLSLSSLGELMRTRVRTCPSIGPSPS